MRWTRRRHSAIALDAGAASVALCQLARGGGHGPVELDTWSIVEDPLRERPGELLHGIPSAERPTRLVKQRGFRGREASLALKPPDVAFHAVTVPEAMSDAPRSQWLTMLRFEAARATFGGQCGPEGLEVDYWHLPPGNRSGNNVMVAAVRREALDRWCAFYEALGLELRLVDVLPCVLVRAAWNAGLPGARTAQAGSDALWGVLDIGFSSSLIAVALGARCIYARPLTISGDAFTLAIVDALNVDYRSAEMLKRRYAPAGGVSAPRRPVTAAAGAPTLPAGDPTRTGEPLDDLMPMLQSVLRARVRALAGELERAFAYTMENYAEATPSALYLCGGGTKLPALAEELQALLGVEVSPLAAARTLVPRRGSTPASDVDEASLAVSVGLALGDFA